MGWLRWKRELLARLPCASTMWQISTNWAGAGGAMHAGARFLLRSVCPSVCWSRVGLFSTQSMAEASRTKLPWISLSQKQFCSKENGIKIPFQQSCIYAPRTRKRIVLDPSWENKFLQAVRESSHTDPCAWPRNFKPSLCQFSPVLYFFVQVFDQVWVTSNRHFLEVTSFFRKGTIQLCVKKHSDIHMNGFILHRNWTLRRTSKQMIRRSWLYTSWIVTCYISFTLSAVLNCVLLYLAKVMKTGDHGVLLWIRQVSWT